MNSIQVTTTLITPEGSTVLGSTAFPYPAGSSDAAKEELRKMLLEAEARGAATQRATAQSEIEALNRQLDALKMELLRHKEKA